MKETNTLSWVLNGASYLITAIQTNEIMQYIQLGLTILATLVSLAYSIYKWVKKAKQDGKITSEEVGELHDIVKGGIEDVNDAIKKDEE